MIWLKKIFENKCQRFVLIIILTVGLNGGILYLESLGLWTMGTYQYLLSNYDSTYFAEIEIQFSGKQYQITYGFQEVGGTDDLLRSTNVYTGKVFRDQLFGKSITLNNRDDSEDSIVLILKKYGNQIFAQSSQADEFQQGICLRKEHPYSLSYFSYGITIILYFIWVLRFLKRKEPTRIRHILFVPIVIVLLWMIPVCMPLSQILYTNHDIGFFISDKNGEEEKYIIRSGNYQKLKRDGVGWYYLPSMYEEYFDYTEVDITSNRTYIWVRDVGVGKIELTTLNQEEEEIYELQRSGEPFVLSGIKYLLLLPMGCMLLLNRKRLEKKTEMNPYVGVYEFTRLAYLNPDFSFMASYLEMNQESFHVTIEEDFFQCKDTKIENPIYRTEATPKSVVGYTELLRYCKILKPDNTESGYAIAIAQNELVILQHLENVIISIYE